MACYVRKILGFFPTMCIRNFPPEAFKLHRKLVRKFLRHKKCFAKATEELPEYIARAATLEHGEGATPPDSPTGDCEHAVISLLSDSEVTEESDSGDEEEMVPAKETADA